MRQSDIPIITKCLPATDSHPLRISARFPEPGWPSKAKVVLPWDYAATFNGNHAAAARKLWTEHGWRNSAPCPLAVASIGDRELIHIFRQTY